jgi:hypothetical protein
MILALGWKAGSGQALLLQGFEHAKARPLGTFAKGGLNDSNGLY